VEDVSPVAVSTVVAFTGVVSGEQALGSD